jgi:hypothetical protein
MELTCIDDSHMNMRGVVLSEVVDRWPHIALNGYIVHQALLGCPWVAAIYDATDPTENNTKSGFFPGIRMINLSELKETIVDRGFTGIAWTGDIIEIPTQAELSIINDIGDALIIDRLNTITMSETIPECVFILIPDRRVEPCHVVLPDRKDLPRYEF